MLIVTEQLMILYLFVFYGFLIGKIKKKQTAHSDILSVLLVNFLMPCKVFNTFLRTLLPHFCRKSMPFCLCFVKTKRTDKKRRTYTSVRRRRT